MPPKAIYFLPYKTKITLQTLKLFSKALGYIQDKPRTSHSKKKENIQRLMSKCQMDMEATSKEFLLAKSGKM